LAAVLLVAVALVTVVLVAGVFAAGAFVAGALVAGALVAGAVSTLTAGCAFVRVAFAGAGSTTASDFALRPIPKAMLTPSEQCLESIAGITKTHVKSLAVRTKGTKTSGD
jgi:hypothetical protein